MTATAEVLGKLVLSQGLASSFRPRRYYTIPHEALESILEDVEQLINFFVIEFQRIVFAENVIHTIAVSFKVLDLEILTMLTSAGLFGFRARLLADQVPPSLGSLPHRYERHLPRPLDLHQQSRADRHPPFECTAGCELPGQSGQGSRGTSYCEGHGDGQAIRWGLFCKSSGVHRVG